MGRKKKRADDKLFCYYCNREFDDGKVLVLHQKAKHFKCHVCNRKLSSANGMVQHVLQVHKEVVTKVPNAKPSRESTEIRIYGMRGIPPEVLAAYYGEMEEDTPSKSARVDNPTSNVGDGKGVIPGGAVGVTFPPQTTYGVMQPPIMMDPRNGPEKISEEETYRYNPAAQPPPAWQAPPPQPWYPPPAAVSMPPGAPPNLPQQPFFPATNITTLSSFPPVPPQPPFQSNVASIHNQSLTITPPPLAASMSAHPDSHASTTGSGDSITSISGQKTGGPSIRPPPPIANKAPAARPAVDWVYFAWDDEAMSMEERRMALPKYRVLNEISQMNSIEKAMERSISETWRGAAR